MIGSPNLDRCCSAEPFNLVNNHFRSVHSRRAQWIAGDALLSVPVKCTIKFQREFSRRVDVMYVLEDDTLKIPLTTTRLSFELCNVHDIINM